MYSATGLRVASNIFRLRARSVQEATETLIKNLNWSLRTKQDSRKRFRCPEYYKHLQRKLGNAILEPNLYLGHACLRHQIGMVIGFWAEEKKTVNMCTICDIFSDSIDTGQKTSYTIQGIDMSPTPRAKPRKKEHHPEEVPDPGSPLPGLPVPVFPDVAIPFVPELPVTEEPEVPMPHEPGKLPKKE